MKKTIKLIDLECANCAAKMESGIAKLPDVTGVSVNFMSQKMVLEAPDDKFDAVLKDAIKIIHKLEPDVTVKA